MFGYVLRRLAIAVPTVLLAVFCIFAAVRSLPNNPVLARMGQHVVPEQVAEAMQRHGWDRPLLAQWVGFLGNAVQGNLGESFITGERVAPDLFRRFAATLELTFAAMVIATPIGLLLGVSGAVWRNKVPDLLCTAASLVGVSVPVFFLGLCLMLVLKDLPTGRRLPIGMSPGFTTDFYLVESLLRGRFDVFFAAAKHVLLPALALSTIPASYIARIARSSLLDVLSSDYVRTAKAKGAPAWRVVFRHALPNAAIPIVNIFGLQLGGLLSGAVLTETVFDWPGLGRRLVEAVQASDYSVAEAGALLVAMMYVLLNLLTDLSWAALDPRVRLGGPGRE